MGIFHIFSYILLVYLVDTVTCVRTKDKMYDTINGASCFRRLNGTHQTGCSSSSSGSVGVLHVIKTESDFDFVINDPPSPPYAPVIPSRLFTRKNVLRLKNEGRKFVSVVVVINQISKDQSFTHELKCPNQYSSLKTDGTCDQNPETTWNPEGTGLLHEDFPFPIYFVSDGEEIDKIVNCFEKFNNFDFETHNSRSLCSIQVNSFMSAAVNSEVCIRRTNFINNLSPTRYCDPLQGKNIFATLFPREITAIDQRSPDREERFIVVSSHLDTTSMFDGVGLGAADSLVSFATLINVAHMLGKILPDYKPNYRNVLFMVFNGEAYDFIGSQRFVYDLKNGGFPAKLTYTNPIGIDQIDLMIDLGVLDDITSLKLHTATTFDSGSKFYSLLGKYSGNFNFTVKSDESNLLPPTSAQSFLRANISFPVVVLNSKPTNLYYHSVYDDALNINYEYKNTSEDFTTLDNMSDFKNFEADSVQIKIRNISSAIAASIYEVITNQTYIKTNETASSILADEFLHCFLQSADCPLFKAASRPHSVPGLPSPPLRYISVQGSYSYETAGWTKRILGFLVGQKHENIKEDKCSPLPLYWFAGVNGEGECYLTTQNFSQAYSPAFLLKGYDWKSGEYSTWTESTWRELNARIFLRPSRTHEAVTLAIGFVVMIISFVIVFLTNSRSDVLFGNSPSTETVTQPAAC